MASSLPMNRTDSTPLLTFLGLPEGISGTRWNASLLWSFQACRGEGVAAGSMSLSVNQIREEIRHLLRLSPCSNPTGISDSPPPVMLRFAAARSSSQY